MNQDSLSFTLTQISYLVLSLNKRNYTQNSRLLSQFVKQYGLEADRHLLRCLFSSINFGVHPSKNSIQAKLLSTELTALLNKSSLISNICFAIDNYFAQQKTLKPSSNLFASIAKTISCSPIQEVAIALALQHSTNSEIVKLAEHHIKVCLPNLIQSYIEIENAVPNQEGSLNDVSPELLQFILSVISHGKHSKYRLSDTVFNKFIKQLCRDFPRDRVPLILAPFLYTEDIEISAEKMSSNSQGILTSAIMDTSWASLVMDIGYAFTSSVDECKNHLMKVGGRDITAPDVSKMIAVMCRTHTNLSDSSINLPTPGSFWSGSQSNDSASKDKSQLGGTSQISSSTSEHTTWKPEIFVHALRDVIPNLNWKDVCLALDNSEFMLKDRTALILVLTIIKLGMQTSGSGQNFPVECVYRHWSNTEGQLSLISTILKNPDLFSFADHIFQSVPVELLKQAPETDNKEIASWKSTHLVEVLLYIAEKSSYPAVLDLFKIPLQHCPDVLFMALLQIPPPITLLRQELFTNLIPIFLGNHTNSGPILHHAWNCTLFSLKQITMVAMSDWYIRGDYDQTRLSRILDVAQDLKALSSLLNHRSFMFVIDLACLASRREYLKLEKWLSDKIREHGEPFVQAIIKFLQRRCPQIMGVKIPEDQIPKAAQLQHETVSTILSCLQACVGSVQQEMADIIMTMSAHCNLLLNKPRQQQPPPPGVLRPHRGMETPFNSSNIASQIFSGPGGVDTLSGLSSNMSGLNIGATSNGAFNFNSVLGNLVSPVSPSRILSGTSNSPFPMMSLQTGGSGGGGNNLGRGISATPTGDGLSMTGSNNVFETPLKVSKEVEDEANSYFQRIYNHPPHPTLSIDEVLDMLQRFQESQIRREREVYQCMLRNLFEEYRFFPQYPPNELQITAQLFGGMVERNLCCTYVALGLALRCVMDALRKPEGSKMFYFGITALDRFKTKLHLYPKYCEYIQSIKHYNDFPPHLIEYVEYGAKGQELPKIQGALPTSLPQAIQSSATATGLYRSNSVTGNIVTTPATVAKPIVNSVGQNSLQTSRMKSIANATNIDTLLVANADRDDKINTPPDTVQDKTAFIFNNLSQLNLMQKCEELKEILIKEYYAWISQYLVMKRASIEVNFHTLYSNFLDALKIQDVNRMVTKETFQNIKVLLRSDKGIANFSDRTLLKNLGHWLGLMTLGRNLPILQIDIDLKSLLVEAYNKGQQELLYVVPFVAKVLESCAKSKVFKPPNPWTMAIMNVLAELHQEPDLKLNLKFEIEVLCKHLNIDVADLKAVIFLKDPDRMIHLEYQLSQPKPTETILSVGQPLLSQNIMPAEEVSSPQTPAPALSMSMSPQNAVGDGSGLVISPPEPKYNYVDISVHNYACINQYITISPSITLLHTHPHLKTFIRTAIEKTITDWINPVVERSVKIALTTSETLCRKDFALDHDENRMRTASHFLTRNLTAGMAMITCRDQLMSTIQNNVKQAFMTVLSVAHKDVAETAAAQIAADNMELACAFIQKSAMEKSVPDIDKRLAADFEIRKISRQDNRRYCDANVLSYQNERMPDQIRLKIGGPTSTQFAVYEEFARNIPGFQQMNERDAAIFIPKATLPEVTVPYTAPYTTPYNNPIAQTQQQVSVFGTDEFGVLYEELGVKMEAFISTAMNNKLLQLQLTNMHALYECLLSLRRNRDTVSANNLLQRAVEGLMEGLINIPDQVELMKHYRDIHLRVMRLLQDPRAFGPVWANKAITKFMMHCREEIKYNLEVIDLLISSNFINLSQFDQILSQSIEIGNTYSIAFAMQLIQHYCINDRQNSIITENDLFQTIEVLVRLVATQRAPEGLAHLLEMLKINHDPSSIMMDRSTNGVLQQIHSGILLVRTQDLDDPPGLLEKTEQLLKDWMQIYHSPQHAKDPEKTFAVFVNKMNILGVTKTDELVAKFYHQAAQMCIDLVYRHLNDPNINQALAKNKFFQFIDAFARLIAMLVKHSGNICMYDNTGNIGYKIAFVNKILGIIGGVLLKDQELRRTGFQQIGFHRIFIMTFLELSAPEPIFENISLNVVTAFSHIYHILNPTLAPGFCYSWLELIAHRVFIGRILAMIPQQKGWSMYAQLLIDLFTYLAPFLRNAELAKPVTLLYKGTLRVLLVLLHDFPEFLCDYHFSFCDVIPPNCIQMRNLILSAFPRNMRLPDPFTPNLKVDTLKEISSAPKICTNYVANIHPASFKKDLDSYLKMRTPVTFLSELRSYLQISNEPGSRYNVPLMNALVLYVGTQAIAHIRSKSSSPSMTTIVHCAHMDIFQNLAVDLDNEGRYLFINAICNQLRYPNIHTHYFSCALLYLFAEANSEALQEQITRVLLERLIVNRPHPWGLLITFIELIKNQTYKFWDHDFVHCAPEIEKLFDSVARSCLGVSSNHQPQMSMDQSEQHKEFNCKDM